MTNDYPDIRKYVDDLVAKNPDTARDLLTALSEALNATAAHVEENWQDQQQARAWRRIATKVDNLERFFDEHKPY